MHEQACQLLQGLYEASRYVESHRMPELFCGFHKRPEESGPTSYPVACAPQAWAAGSVFLLLSAALGLEVRATDPQSTFTSPCLPESVDWIEIQDLQISKDVAIDAQIRRFGSIVKAEVYAKCGTLEIVTNP
jgi:glycogen debranching enzyme